MSFRDHLRSTGSGRHHKFEEVNSEVKGTVVNFDPAVERPNFDNTGTELIPVIALEADDGSGPIDVWLNKPQMQAAVEKALSEHGATCDLERGGWLAIRRVEDGVPTRPGYSPPHGYQAWYRPPQGGVGAPAPAPAPGPATAAPVGVDSLFQKTSGAQG